MSAAHNSLAISDSDGHRWRLNSGLYYTGLAVLALIALGYNWTLLNRGLQRHSIYVQEPSNPTYYNVDPKHPLKHTFIIVNPLSRPVSILSIKTGCTCTTSNFNKTILDPGKSVPFEVTIKSFKSFTNEFSEAAFIETDRGNLEVWISGSLAIPPAARFYPQALYVELDAESRLPDRIVRVKVPAECLKESKAWTAELVGRVEGGIRITKGHLEKKFQELEIHLSFKRPEKDVATKGLLRVDFGCSPIEIPITIAR